MYKKKIIGFRYFEKGEEIGEQSLYDLFGVEKMTVEECHDEDYFECADLKFIYSSI